MGFCPFLARFGYKKLHTLEITYCRQTPNGSLPLTGQEHISSLSLGLMAKLVLEFRQPGSGRSGNCHGWQGVAEYISIPPNNFEKIRETTHRHHVRVAISVCKPNISVQERISTNNSVQHIPGFRLPHLPKVLRCPKSWCDYLTANISLLKAGIPIIST